MEQERLFHEWEEQQEQQQQPQQAESKPAQPVNGTKSTKEERKAAARAAVEKANAVLPPAVLQAFQRFKGRDDVTHITFPPTLTKEHRTCLYELARTQGLFPATAKKLKGSEPSLTIARWNIIYTEARCNARRDAQRAKISVAAAAGIRESDAAAAPTSDLARKVVKFDYDGDALTELARVIEAFPQAVQTMSALDIIATAPDHHDEEEENESFGGTVMLVNTDGSVAVVPATPEMVAAAGDGSLSVKQASAQMAQAARDLAQAYRAAAMAAAAEAAIAAATGTTVDKSNVFDHNSPNTPDAANADADEDDFDLEDVPSSSLAVKPEMSSRVTVTRPPGGFPSVSVSQHAPKRPLHLPAFARRDEFYYALDRHQVVIVAGATGSGKSTQFPQFILDRAEALRAAGRSHTASNADAAADGLLPQPSEVRVVVTEPRRIAAIALATRVAEERGEEIVFGDESSEVKPNYERRKKNAGTVGYSIRHESQQSQKTRLLFCTVGILLRRITSSRSRALELRKDSDSASKSAMNPLDDAYWTDSESPFVQRLLQALSGVTHIIIDEVHERGKMTDFLLIVVKHILPHRRDLRLILMSATVDAQLFADYFGGNVPVVEVEGRTFPVDIFHAHELLTAFPRACNRLVKRNTLQPIEHPARLSNEPMQGLPPAVGPSAVHPSDAADAAATAYLVRLEETFGLTVSRAALVADTRKLRGDTVLPLFMDLLMYIMDREIPEAELDAMEFAMAGSKLATAQRSGRVWTNDQESSESDDADNDGDEGNGKDKSKSKSKSKLTRNNNTKPRDEDQLNSSSSLVSSLGNFSLSTPAKNNASTASVQAFDEFGLSVTLTSPPAPGFAPGLFPTAAHDASKHHNNSSSLSSISLSRADIEPSTPNVIARLKADDSVHGHPWRDASDNAFSYNEEEESEDGCVNPTIFEEEGEEESEDGCVEAQEKEQGNEFVLVKSPPNEPAKDDKGKDTKADKSGKAGKAHKTGRGRASKAEKTNAGKAGKSSKPGRPAHLAGGAPGPSGPECDENVISDLPDQHPGLPPRDRLPYGAILVFLPSWDTITEIMTEISLHPVLGDQSRFWVVPLHSSLTSEEQRDAFVRPERGQWKIILTTNIAETSITVEDVVYVIDFGLVKEKLYDAKANVSSFCPAWIARSNATQRAGRAGRVRRGLCFRLYSEMLATQMAPAALPELLTAPLEDVVLTVKALLMGPPEDAHDRNQRRQRQLQHVGNGGRGRNRNDFGDEEENEDAYDDDDIVDDDNEDVTYPARVGETMAFLARAIEPPEQEFVTKTIKDLRRLNAIDNDEYLTDIGRFFITLPIEARYARMLLLAALLGVFDPVLTFVAAESCAPLFLLGKDEERELIQATKIRFACEFQSDTMATLGAFNECVKAKNRKEFCKANYMKFAVFIAIVRTKQQLLQIFKSAPALRSILPQNCAINYAGKLLIWGDCDDEATSNDSSNNNNADSARRTHFNCNAHRLLLVEAVIAAGLYPQIAIVQPRRKVLRSAGLLRPPVGLVPFARYSLARIFQGPAPCPLVGYGEAVGSPWLTLRSITFLSPLAALVLAPANKTVLDYDTSVTGAYVDKYNNMLNNQQRRGSDDEYNTDSDTTDADADEGEDHSDATNSRSNRDSVSDGGGSPARPRPRPRAILHIDEWLGVDVDIAAVANLQLLRALVTALYQLAATRGLTAQARALGVHLGTVMAAALQEAAEQRQTAVANNQGLRATLALPAGLQGRVGVQRRQPQPQPQRQQAQQRQPADAEADVSDDNLDLQTE